MVKRSLNIYYRGELRDRQFYRVLEPGNLLSFFDNKRVTGDRRYFVSTDAAGNVEIVVRTMVVSDFFSSSQLMALAECQGTYDSTTHLLTRFESDAKQHYLITINSVACDVPFESWYDFNFDLNGDVLKVFNYEFDAMEEEAYHRETEADFGFEERD